MTEESLFAAVLEMETPSERQAFLDSACHGDFQLRERLTRLLAGHDRQAGMLDHGGAKEYLATEPGAVNVQSNMEKPGSWIGPYQLKELIGEGGFGLVYVAEQLQPLRRLVALKLIKPGMDSREIIARFEAERQALALMDHPHIARVLDAGTTSSGRPFFVMELVRGVAMTEYGDQARLTTRERLALFITVCQAVQHAHQKGIIHRDLKPSNVLVTRHDDKPVVKVIDFGIAKALHQRLTDHSIYTRFAQMMGTPSYMSPEQAEMNGLDVDTRSDIYSLGVLLYELLTGTTPFERDRLQNEGLDEWRRMLREDEPVKPSTRISTLGMAATTVSSNRRSDPRQLSQLFRGELDWIVMKALEKDRNRRYATAADMARDVERFLRDEPVEASPPSSLYRMRKFLQRHRGPMLAAGIVLLVLIGGVIGTTAGMLKAQQAQHDEALRAEEEARQRKRAEIAEGEAKAFALETQRNADVALGLVDFLRKDLLGQAGMHSQAMGQLQPDPHMTVRAALDRAAAKLGDRFKEQTDIEAAIRSTIGASYRQLGLYDKAIDQLQRAVKLRSRDKDKYRNDAFNTRIDLALAYRDAGRATEAITLLLEVHRDQVAELGPEHAHTLTTLDNLAVACRDAGRRTEAMELFERVREARVRTLGPEDPSTLCTLHNLATTYLDANNIPEAVKRLEQVRDTMVKVHGPEHLDTLPTLNNLAAAYWKSGKLDKSIPIVEQLVPVYQRLLGVSHPQTYAIQANLGVNYRDAGRFDEAINLLEKSHQAVKGLASMQWIAGELQIAYIKAGRKNEAIAFIKSRAANAAKPHDSLQHAQFLSQCSFSLIELKAWQDAEALLAQCLAIRHSKSPETCITFNTQSVLGGVMVELKKYAEAEPHLLAGYHGIKKNEATWPANGRQLLKQSVLRLIRLYREIHKPDEEKKWSTEKDKLNIAMQKQS